MTTKNTLLFVVLSAAILTGLTASTMSLAAPTFADKKKCEDNDNKNCNDTHKTQKIDQENRCKVENEIEEHSSHNGNENRLECVNFGVNLNDVLVTPSGVGSPPTSTTGKLTVIEDVVGCEQGTPDCPSPSLFRIFVFGNNPSPSEFEGDPKGTEVTIGAGEFEILQYGLFGFLTSFSGDCDEVQHGALNIGVGNMEAGETKTCTITNTFSP